MNREQRSKAARVVRMRAFFELSMLFLIAIGAISLTVAPSIYPHLP